MKTSKILNIIGLVFIAGAITLLLIDNPNHLALGIVGAAFILFGTLYQQKEFKDVHSKTFEERKQDMIDKLSSKNRS